jgi:hypothetical protein
MSDLLTVVLWLWGQGSTGAGWRPVYNAERVNIAARMIRANLSLPHRIVCITDMPKGVKECDTVPLWDSHPTLRPIREGGTLGAGKPNCFRRLVMFHPEHRLNLLGSSHMLHIDLDAIVTGSLDALISEHDFRIMHGYRVAKYNGSMWMLRGEAERQVFDTFDPHTAPALIKAAGYVGSDQGWISLKVDNAATYGPKDGCYQYMRLAGLDQIRIPHGMRVCFFAGGRKPWDKLLQRRGAYLHREYMKYAATPRKSATEA